MRRPVNTISIITQKFKDRFINNSRGYEVHRNFEEVIMDISAAALFETDNLIPTVSIDFETNGLDPLTLDVLLIGISVIRENCQNIYIVLNDMVDEATLLFKGLGKARIIAHNAKFELSILDNKYNYSPVKVLDTMIADQTIYQGLGKSNKNPTGFSFGLSDCINRHLSADIELDKTVRSDFIGIKKEDYVPSMVNIDYLIDDVKYLYDLIVNQIEVLRKHKLLDFYLNTNCPLTKVLSDMEVNGGFYLNKEKWIANIEANKEARFTLECQLDLERNKLRDTLLTKENALFIKSVFYDTPRKKISLVGNDLFGEPLKLNKKYYNESKRNLFNYSSDLQLKKLFARLMLPLPTEHGYKIPIIVDDSLIDMGIDYEHKAILESHYPIKEKIPQSLKSYLDYYSFTVKKDDLAAMLIKMPNHPAKEFILLLEKYSEVNTKLTNYGENYLTKIDKSTKKIHTIYRQLDAITGRLQSGGGKKLPNKINSQNIPRSNDYRTCFHAGIDYDIITCDLSGAETVIMADKANDKILFKLAIEEDDIHSPAAQLAWRNIYLFRAGVIARLWTSSKEFWSKRNLIKEEILPKAALENYKLSQELIITKKVNTHLRTQFKPIFFGTVYGAYDKKIAQVLNINVEEGAIVIETLKRLCPATFQMVEKNARFACGVYEFKRWKVKPNGYVPINNVSNNRILLPNIIEAIKTGEPPYAYGESVNLCRNAPIQGTQADMIKVAMVLLFDFFEENKLDAKLLIQVHDELVVKSHKKYQNQKFNFLGKELTIPEIVQEGMTYAANLFLNNIKMKAEVVVADTWIK